MLLRAFAVGVSVARGRRGWHLVVRRVPAPRLPEHADLGLCRCLCRPLEAEAGQKKLSDEDRRGLTALFWSNINPDKRLDLGLPVSVPRPRCPQSTATVAR
ncbi:hypothetical protein ACFZAR_44830 [Streptomyces sp. NPDC008222]|uniref:hypothetical protein n=1 Tax=Streptomyces sp. NPDC008222 TaxID=3364820 RepID=UPI0036ECBF70